MVSDVVGDDVVGGVVVGEVVDGAVCSVVRKCFSTWRWLYFLADFGSDHELYFSLQQQTNIYVYVLI